VLVCVALDTLRQRRLHPACAWAAARVLASTHMTYLAQLNS
jgi:hypothetical protein